MRHRIRISQMPPFEAAVKRLANWNFRQDSCFCRPPCKQIIIFLLGEVVYCVKSLLNGISNFNAAKTLQTCLMCHGGFCKTRLHERNATQLDLKPFLYVNSLKAFILLINVWNCRDDWIRRFVLNT